MIAVHGERFTGEGYFRFALVDELGYNLWTNDGSGVATPDPPTDSVTLTVVNGIYNVRLGDESLTDVQADPPSKMTAIPRAVFNEHDKVALRIWFDDGVNGVHRLTPDQLITSSPYAQRLPNVFVDEATGNVGIGTTTPDAKFHVSGQEGAPHGKAASIALSNTAAGGNNWYLRVGADGTTTPAGGLSIADDDAYHVTIADDGNVGIGTTDPMQKLEVVGTTRMSSIEITQASGFGLVPPGAIMPFAGANPPSGWLLCDGRAVERDEYGALYTAIGDAWGAGDGQTTFHLPDLRGRFLRGVDHGAGRDPDRASRSAANSGGNTGDNVGSVQASATAKPHVPFIGKTDEEPEFDPAANGGGYPYLLGSDGYHTQTGGDYTPGEPNLRWMRRIRKVPAHDHDFDTESWGGGDNETRPVNAYVNWIIKY